MIALMRGRMQKKMEELKLFELEQEESERPASYDEKIKQAQDTLKLAAEISKEYYNEPLIVKYSGGKDSDVMLDIALNCLEADDFEVVNSHTTVDAPQTVRHIEQVFRKLNDKGIKTRYTNRYPTKKTMWSLIVEKQMPPTRLKRYCCVELKESTTLNRICALGVREDESKNRQGRSLFQLWGGHAKRQQWSLNHAREVFQEAKEYDEVFDCIMVTKAKNQEDLICNPIYYFTEFDVWSYIVDHALEVNPLYKMGYKRVGCVGCPLGGRKSQLKEFADFPKYQENYIRAFDRMLEARRKSGKDDVTGKESYHAWRTGHDVFDWWVEDGKHFPKGQMTIDEWKNNI